MITHMPEEDKTCKVTKGATEVTRREKTGIQDKSRRIG
jgi:hypothetical protein